MVTLDASGWGAFHKDYSIAVEPLPASGKPLKTTYWLRTTPKKSGTEYISASKYKKISVDSIQKAPNYKVKGDVTKLKANTIFNGTFYKDGISVKLKSGDKIWQAATVKKPASAKQTI